MKEESPLWAEAKLGYLVLTVKYVQGVPTLPFEFIRIEDNTGERVSVHTGELKTLSSPGK